MRDLRNELGIECPIIRRCERCGTTGPLSLLENSVCGQFICDGCRLVGKWTVGRSPDELAEILMLALSKRKAPSFVHWLENTVEKWCKNKGVIDRARGFLSQLEKEVEI